MSKQPDKKASAPILRPTPGPLRLRTPAVPVAVSAPAARPVTPAPVPAPESKRQRARLGAPSAIPATVGKPSSAAVPGGSKIKDITIGGTSYSPWVLLFVGLTLLFVIKFMSSPRERVQRFYTPDGGCMVAPIGGGSGFVHLRDSDKCKDDNSKWVSVTTKSKGTIHPVKNRKLCLQSNWLFSSVKECKKGAANQQFVVGSKSIMKAAKPNVCLSKSKIPFFGSFLSSSRCRGSDGQTFRSTRSVWK